MKLLYAGLNSGTSLSRFQTLQSLAGAAEMFDTSTYFARLGRLAMQVESLLFMGSQISAMNRDLIEWAALYRPDVLWIDRGTWIYPGTLRRMREMGIFLVHHFTDALFPLRWRVRRTVALVRKTLSLFDMIITSNIDDHRWMRDRGLSSELTYLAYDHRQFNADPLPPAEYEKWKSELLFAGHHEARTEKGALALIEAGLPLTLYGQAWHHAKNKAKLAPHLRPEYLTGERYVNALKAAKIGICWVSEINYNQTSARSFEIPACGTFLLAMRTPQHQEAYEEGKEAEFFGDNEELVRKAKYYLQHEAEREAIARRGHERCVKSEYTWERYTRDDFAKVKAAVEARERD